MLVMQMIEVTSGGEVVSDDIVVALRVNVDSISIFMLMVGIAIGIAVACTWTKCSSSGGSEAEAEKCSEEEILTNEDEEVLQAEADESEEKNDALEEVQGEAASSSEESFEEKLLQRMRVDELRGLLRRRGLKVSGRKADVVERLVSDGWKPAGQLGFQ